MRSLLTSVGRSFHRRLLGRGPVMLSPIARRYSEPWSCLDLAAVL